MCQRNSKISQNKEYEILGVQIIHRHGARYPINDQGGAEIFADKYEELSNVGKRQLYMLGRYLNLNYIQDNQFLDSFFNPKNIQIFSTDYNRTIDSVDSLFQGLYPQGQGLKIDEYQLKNSNPPWNNNDKIKQQFKNNEYSLPKGITPTIIHSIEKKYLLAFSGNYCQSMADEYYKNIDSQDVQDTIEIVKTSVQYFCKVVNLEYPPNIQDIYEYVDTWLSFLYISPTFQNDELDKILQKSGAWEDLLFIYSQYFQIIFNNKREINYMTSTPIFEKIIENFDNIINPQLNHTPKQLTIYSAHDATVSMVWNRLGLTSWECQNQLKNNNFKGKICLDYNPQYSSQVIFELLKNKQEQYFIKIYADGEQVPIEACGDKFNNCKFKEFQKYIQQNQIKDFQEWCRPVDIYLQEQKESVSEFMFILISILFSINISILYCIYQSYKKLKRIQNFKKFEQNSKSFKQEMQLNTIQESELEYNNLQNQQQEEK